MYIVSNYKNRKIDFNRASLRVSRTDPAAIFSSREEGVWFDPSDLSTMFQDEAGTTPVTAPGQSVGLVLDKSRGSLAPRRNLYRYSQTMTNTNWQQNRTTVASSGTTSTPRGVLPYFKVTATGNDPQLAQHVTTGPVANRTFTLSFVAWTDAGQPTEAALFFFGTTGVEQVKTVNITLTTTPTVYTLTGSFTGTAASSSVTARIDLKEIPTIGDYIYVTAAQFEEGASASAYQETADFPVAWIGSHATQATAAAMPTYGVEPLGGRRNLLTMTEVFGNAVWSKTSTVIVADAAVAPNGSSTADKVYPSVTSAAAAINRNTTGFAAASTISASCYFKAAEKGFGYIQANGQTGGTVVSSFVTVDLATGSVGTIGVLAGGGLVSATASSVSVGNGWWRLTLSGGIGASNTAAEMYVGVCDAQNSRSVAASGTNGIFIWGAQLETGSTATNYQRVGSAFDVTEAGVPSLGYLSFDGVDDWFVTPTITPGIDKVQVFAGVRKLSDATGIIAELSASAATNSGSSYLISSESTGVNSDFRFKTRGTLDAPPPSSGPYLAPTTQVLAGLGDIAADRATLRIGGVQVAQSTADQGTGNFLAYPLYIGRRGGTSLPFNGRIYGLIVRFGANLTADQITRTETWMNSKTGAY